MVDRHLEAFLEMLAAERGAARNTLLAYQSDLADFANSTASSSVRRSGRTIRRSFSTRRASPVRSRNISAKPRSMRCWPPPRHVRRRRRS